MQNAIFFCTNDKSHTITNRSVFSPNKHPSSMMDSVSHSQQS